MSDWGTPRSSTELLTKSIAMDDFRQMVSSGMAVFALIDACDEPSVPGQVNRLGRSRAISLYRAKAERNYASFAPYLFAVDGPLLSWIEDNLFGKPWGYFFTTAGGHELEVLRRHWRRFLQVTSDDGQSVYFRFYDPRIVVPFLNACTPEERIDFLRPVKSLVVEQSGQLRSFALAPNMSARPADETGHSSANSVFAMQPRHTQAFIENKRERIERELCDMLRSDYYDDLKRLGISDAQLPQVVHTAIDNAKHCSVVGRQDVELYLISMLRLGLDFDTNLRLGWPHETLNRRDLTGSEKMDIFYARLFAQQEAESA